MPNPTEQTAAKWYEIKAQGDAAAAGARAAEIYIYGDIGHRWDENGVIAADLVRELAALDVDAIILRINSYGGSVPDGLAIFNALKRHKASVDVQVDGVAISCAGYIAMAGDTVTMAANAMLMIHAPWGMAIGNSADLRDQADMLDKYAAAMATSYATKSGKSRDECMALLTDGKDHWYTADEAQAESFCDSVGPAVNVAASIARSYDLSRFSTPVAAATNHQEHTMPEVNPAATAAAPFSRTKEQSADILAFFKPFASREGVADLQTQVLADPAVTVEAASSKLLTHLAKDTTPAVPAGAFPVIETLEDERDKFRKGAQASIMARAGLAKDDTANNYRSYSLVELAKSSLVHAGRRIEGMSKMDVVAAAFTHTNSDFANMLSNTAEKAMLKGYEEAEETFQKWTSVGTLSDFKASKRVDLDTFPSLAVVAEGAEYKSATFGDRGETVQLATYGRLFSITRQAIINDDLAAFSRIPRNMGNAAIRTIGNLVYAVLTANAAMADGVALFHANHGNLLTGAGINTASVDAIMAAMRKQKDATGNTLNVRAAYLLCPVAIEGLALQVANSEFEIGASAKNNTTPNWVRGRFEVISDARLDDNSVTAWYAAASAGMFDTVEVSYLDGQTAPVLEQKDGWTTDGVEFKVRIDAGVKALDHRTLARNPGA